MNKKWIKRICAVMVFLAAVIITDKIVNSQNVEMTMEMPKATLPVVSVVAKDYVINTMYGYTEKREESYTKENITPIERDRQLTISINEYGNDIETVSYEVRSTDGERLIERSDVTILEKNGEETRFTLQLKDLTEENKEYAFVTILGLEDQRKVYYYTRFIEQEEFHLKEKLDFILDFHNTTFDGGDGSSIKKYMETNGKMDNNNFHYVNINSSIKQVMWDELSVKRIDNPRIMIKDITESTAMAVLQYLVEIDVDGSKRNAFVEEYFRVRYTPDRIYLLNYERTLEEIFEPGEKNLMNDKIVLGITSDQVEMQESEGGTNLAFINSDRLFSYNSNDNRIM